MRSTEFQSSLQAGHAHLAAGRFFEAHEAWEIGWLATRGREKQLLQVLVLWTTALHHARNDNRVGALNVMQRALERLQAAGAEKALVDVEVLRDALVHSWEEISGLSADQGPLPSTPLGMKLEPTVSISVPAWTPFDAPVTSATDPVELVHRTHCPYCGEPVAVEIDAALASGAEYVEDCPVCCHPWSVQVRDDGGQMAVVLQRDDE